MPETMFIDQLVSFADRVDLQVKFARKFDELYGFKHPEDSLRLDEEAEDAVDQLADRTGDVKLSELVCEVLASPEDHILRDVFWSRWLQNGVFDSTTADHEWSDWADSFGDYVTAKHIWLEANGKRGL